MTDYAPRRGDVIRLNFNPQAGHEQSGRRPAVVLSPVEYNTKVGLALMCPITSQRKEYPFEVYIPEDLPVSGVILSDQVKSLDWRSRRAEYVCSLPAETVAEILVKIGLLLDDDR